MISTLFIASGCATLPQKTPQAAVPAVSIEDARSAADEGELYEARRKTEEILKADPGNQDAQLLMAKIIDEEIARHKETFETTAPEEFTQEQKTEEAKTWLERARGLLALQEYDEAMLAAEKVFLTDPDNTEASALVDEIRNEALATGKEQMLIQNQVTRSEIDDRVKEYYMQVEDWMRREKWGAARITVDKILMLSPEDEKALQLRDIIRSKTKGKTA